MSTLIYNDGSFSVGDKEIIFSENQACQSVNILVKGKVDIYLCFDEGVLKQGEVEIAKNSFRLFSVDRGYVLGCEGLFDEGLQYYTYKAAENSNIFVFFTPSISKLQELIDTHSEYGAYIVTSIANTITNCVKAYSKVNKLLWELEILTDNLTTYFWYYKEKLNFSSQVTGSGLLSKIDTYESLKEKNIIPPAQFAKDFFVECHNSDILIEGSEFDYDDSSDAIYYKRFLNMPLEIRKDFFGCDFNITAFHCRQGIQYLNELNEKLRESFKRLHSLYTMLCSNSEDSLLTQYAKASCGMNLNNPSTQDFLKLIGFIGENAKYYIDCLTAEYGNDFGMDSEYISNIVSQVTLGINPFDEAAPEVKITDPIYDNIPEELQDSARKILDYSGVDEEAAAIFLANLESFRMLKDKFATDDNTQAIRKKMTASFFTIYEGVMKRVIAEKPQSRLYHMFLNFGYMDERLLLPEQTLSLYSAVEKFSSNGSDQIYCMRDWLFNIYEMKRDPSMNEFSMDYNDVFRDMKKRGEVTDKDKQAYMSNKAGRLEFEITNVFRSNHKVCYGQPTTYFPILHRDVFVRDLEKALVTPDKVAASLERILKIDYSAFHREINYKNDKKGIEKELIMLKVMPDIILMPIFGSRGIMWQEISGRNRSAPGRFILPIMTAENLDDMIVKLVGNFRWELCRTMMGVSWNDITQKSLTSEYTDYIQFYKKNRDLTEDVKQKIGVQIVKARSLMREIFTSDYELWFNYESSGIIRLNKVARSILYRYCPFNSEIRDNLTKHPLFSEIDSRYRIQHAKQIREIDNHYKKLTRSGLELDEAMNENLKFYKEM